MRATGQNSANRYPGSVGHGARTPWPIVLSGPEEEQVVAVRGSSQDQSEIQDNYAAAARGLAERARVEGAAAHLGVEDLAGMGVAR